MPIVWRKPRKSSSSNAMAVGYFIHGFDCALPFRNLRDVASSIVAVGPALFARK